MLVVLTTLMPESDVTHGLAMRTLKSYLVHRGPVDAIDVVLKTFSLRASDDAIVAELLRLGPAVIGFSAYLWNSSRLAGVARRIRAAAVPPPLLVAGGPDATHDPERYARQGEFDVTVAGEGEAPFLRIVETLLRGSTEFGEIPDVTFRQGPARFATTRAEPGRFADLASHDFPLELDPDGHRSFRYETTRGCLFRCRYCRWERTGSSRIRYYPVEKVKRDLEQIFGLPHVAVLEIVDSTFFRPDDRARGLEILETIHALNAGRQAAGLAPVGVVTEQNPLFLDAQTCASLGRLPHRNGAVAFGLQTIDAEVNRRVLDRGFNPHSTLARLTELSRTLGGRLSVDVIYGLPGERYEGYRRSLEFALSLRLAHVNMFHFLVLPGTSFARDPGRYGIRYETASPHRLLASDTWSRDDLLAAAKLSLVVYLFYCEDVAPPLNPVRASIVNEFRQEMLPFFDRVVHYLETSHRPLFDRWVSAFGVSMLDGLTDAWQFFARMSRTPEAGRILNDVLAMARAYAAEQRRAPVTLSPALSPGDATDGSTRNA